MLPMGLSFILTAQLQTLKLQIQTPMGVVFDAGNRLAMALVEVKDDVTGEMVMTWANKAYKIP